MADLIAKPPMAGQGALTLGALTLAPLALGRVTSVAPFQGQDKKAAAALKPLGFPAPNQIITKAGRRIIWTGRGQAFLMGDVPEGLAAIAALTDQSDGWAGLSLTGPKAAECLMRLVPLDLDAMQPGQAARAPLGHMQSILWRQLDGFDLMVFRSMVTTAWHETSEAMKSLAARQAL